MTRRTCIRVIRIQLVLFCILILLMQKSIQSFFDIHLLEIVFSTISIAIVLLSPFGIFSLFLTKAFASFSQGDRSKVLSEPASSILVDMFVWPEARENLSQSDEGPK